MKRSEMVQKIREELLGKPYAGLEFAEIILAAVEKAGMRPPLLLKQVYKGPVEGWEPENEEK